MWRLTKAERVTDEMAKRVTDESVKKDLAYISEKVRHLDSELFPKRIIRTPKKTGAVKRSAAKRAVKAAPPKRHA